MKLRYKVLIALFLIVLPLAARWFWYNRGRYQPPVMAEIDHNQVVPVIPEYRPVADEPQPATGRVIIDLIHDNNLGINDLAPLQDRLKARGLLLETLTDMAEQSLESRLRGATALVSLAPTTRYTAEEREAVKTFVADGGRLLLAADPTRPVPIPAEEQDLFTIFFPTSSTPAINSLADTFGIIYFDDYVYNLNANEGNYRNVRFTDLNPVSPLTRDLDSVVLFASHSLRSNGPVLIRGDDQTLSPARSGETGLVVAALSADEHVLALGDVTFLTPPYHTIADNDRLLSHIADWLGGSERTWDLADFPYLFEGPVDLIQASGTSLDPRMVAGASELESTFEQAGLTLTLRAAPQPAHDVLYVGTFEDTRLIHDYLVTAGITITMVITPTDEITPTGTEAPVAAEISITPMATLTATSPLTRSQGLTPAGEKAELPGEMDHEKPHNEVEIAGLGSIRWEGTSLFVVNRSQDRVIVVALAEDGATTAEAVRKLASGDLSGCAEGEPVTLCSSGEAGTGESADTGTEDQESNQDENLPSRIFILSKDDGTTGQRTSAEEIGAILEDTYRLTIWSVSQDGVPTADDVTGYDAYIIDSGDFAYDPDAMDTLSAFGDITDAGVMFIGEQPILSSQTEPAMLDDIEVADAAHPLAEGFETGQVISLLPSESGVPTVVLPEKPEDDSSDTTVVFNRGPASPEAGQPALLAASAQGNGHRVILAGFAFYRLPEEAQRLFALNAAKWLLEK